MADILIREATAFQSNPLSPVPQYWNTSTSSYEKVQGVNGAPRTIIYDAAGVPLLTAANPGNMQLPVVGTHANAWNAISVLAAGNSNSIDCQRNYGISAFGNVSAATTITAYVSQDNVNFYATTNNIVISAAGNFHFSFQSSARYVRLQSSGVATITATIAGK